MTDKSGQGNPMMDHVDDRDKDKDLNYVLTKFLTRGYDALTDEELAVTLINPDYNSVFKKKTGIDWVSKYQVQTVDRLKRVNFDLNFMTSYIQSEKFNPFFLAVIKGDLEKIREYYKKYSDDEMVCIVDVSKKSPLHHAAREGRTSVTDYLITKGYRVNARERTLKTPLHYACLFGHTVLAGLKPELIKIGDHLGRTGLHYAVWNS